MDSVLNGAAGNAVEGNSSSLGEAYDLDLTPEDDESSTAEDDFNETGESDGGSSYVNEPYEMNPTNQAFAQMRTQNREYASKINELDAIAKAAGLNGVDDLIAQSKEAQIRREAEAQGIPEAVARELAEMREFREEIKQRDIRNEYQAREMALVNNLQDFIGKNNLSNDSVRKMSDDLMRDGLTNDYLMDLPRPALNKILSAYAGTSTQKLLERKDAIRTELPLDQTSQVSSNTINKEIDDIARMFAGK